MGAKQGLTENTSGANEVETEEGLCDDGDIMGRNSVNKTVNSLYESCPVCLLGDPGARRGVWGSSQGVATGTKRGDIRNGTGSGGTWTETAAWRTGRSGWSLGIETGGLRLELRRERSLGRGGRM